MIVCPVVVKLLRRDAFLTVVEELDMKHSLHVHGASSLIGHATTLFWKGGIGRAVGATLREPSCSGKGQEWENMDESHFDLVLLDAELLHL